jgi:hypothetical protein
MASPGNGFNWRAGMHRLMRLHQDSPDECTVVDRVATFAGARRFACGYQDAQRVPFQLERGAAPAAAPGTPPPTAAPGGRGRGPQGPMVAAWFVVMKQ